MTLQEAYESLGLSRGAGPAEVKAAYRALIADAHPDRGGDTAGFIKIRAAYEILSAFLHEPALDDAVPIPDSLRSVIERVVRDFRGQQMWAEQETRRQMGVFEARMSEYLQSASRRELRQFSITFKNSWDASIGALFSKCNARCDYITQEYESWYTANTQAVFDEMYRKELRSFARRRRFWEVLLVLAVIGAALGWVVGWDGPGGLWTSVVLIVAACGVAFWAHRRSARRRRLTRERVEPLSVVPFEIPSGARFQGEMVLRRGRKTTAGLGMAGLFAGSAAAGGLAVPVLAAIAGAALGGAFDRLFNPTRELREGMLLELHRFTQVAGPQVVAYVLEAHERLLTEVREQIVANYEERVRGTVKLLTADCGGGVARDGAADGAKARGAEGGCRRSAETRGRAAESGL